MQLDEILLVLRVLGDDAVKAGRVRHHLVVDGGGEEFGRLRGVQERLPLDDELLHPVGAGLLVELQRVVAPPDQLGARVLQRLGLSAQEIVLGGRRAGHLGGLRIVHFLAQPIEEHVAHHLGNRRLDRRLHLRPRHTTGIRQFLGTLIADIHL